MNTINDSEEYEDCQDCGKSFLKQDLSSIWLKSKNSYASLCEECCDKLVEGNSSLEELSRVLFTAEVDR